MKDRRLFFSACQEREVEKAEVRKAQTDVRRL
jgi:hypothetical protein